MSPNAGEDLGTLHTGLRSGMQKGTVRNLPAQLLLSTRVMSGIIQDMAI